jgi:tetratricopeptide (TPR) repeat protein
VDGLNVFENLQPPSDKYRLLFLLLKVNACMMLQKAYLATGKGEYVESVSFEGIRLLEQVVRADPEYIAAFQYGMPLFYELGQFYLAQGQPDKILALTEKARVLSVAGAERKDYFFIPDFWGSLTLNQALLHDIWKKWDSLKAVAGESIAHLERARTHLADLGVTRHFLFYRKIGQAYLLRGKAHAQADDAKSAEEDLAAAISYFERALEYNPLYGKASAALRDEALKLRNGLTSTSKK